MNKPLSDRILLKAHDDGGERVSAGGIVLPDTVKDRPREGMVVEVGSGMNDITGNLVPMEIKVGDTIAFHKSAGTEITIDETNYLIMRESDVLIILNRKSRTEAINEAMEETKGHTENALGNAKEVLKEAFKEEIKKSKKVLEKTFKEETEMNKIDENVIDNMEAAKIVINKTFPEESAKLSEKEIDVVANSLSEHHNMKDLI